jgi:hypothetical protein
LTRWTDEQWDAFFARSCDVLTGAGLFAAFLALALDDNGFALLLLAAVAVLQAVRP